MTDYEKKREKVARVLWDRLGSKEPQPMRAPWLAVEWLQTTDMIIKEVLAANFQEAEHQKDSL